MIVGSVQERTQLTDLAGRIATASRRVAMLAGEAGELELVCGVIALGQAFVANDSGLAHIAQSQRVSGVIVFAGGTRRRRCLEASWMAHRIKSPRWSTCNRCPCATSRRMFPPSRRTVTCVRTCVVPSAALPGSYARRALRPDRGNLTTSQLIAPEAIVIPPDSRQVTRALSFPLREHVAGLLDQTKKRV